MHPPLLIYACNAIGNLTKTLKKKTDLVLSLLSIQYHVFNKKKGHIFRTIKLSYLEQHIVIKLSFLFI